MPRPSLTVLHVVGARPNFVKVAAVLRALDGRASVRSLLVHTDQHYDPSMSAVFFQELDIPPPDVHLGVGSGSHGAQTGRMLAGLEAVIRERSPDIVLVAGDANSTLAGALAAAKLQVPVAHVEAGLRSRDRTMPEELNRIVTDQLSDLCLTPSHDADANLAAEGIEPERIRFVGNVMIDTLDRILPSVRERMPSATEGLEPGSYAVATVHRPSNVDPPGALGGITKALERIAEDVPVVFPMHPRTRHQVETQGLSLRGVRVHDPIGYKDMLALVAHAGLVITDSGGVQEETTVLGIPCLTLRDSTERPITITQGTNRLVPDRSTAAVVDAFRSAWGRPVTPQRPEGWDGSAASRVADALEEWGAARKG